MKIAIASGKGGTGKTTLSTNLANFIAQTQPVVLADLDVEEPNSGLFINAALLSSEDKFKMIPEWHKDTCSLCGNCQDVCNFHAVIRLGPNIMVFPELCHSCYACSELCPTGSLPMIKQKIGEIKYFKKDNLNFVESRLDIGQEQATQLIKQTISYVEQHFRDTNVKIYDSPPGTSCPVIEATRDADFVILVTEPTPFGFHDLKLAIDTVRQLKKKFGVVINRHGIGNNDVYNYCNEENIPILSKIPNSRKIAELYSYGELIYEKVPEFRNELEKILNFLSINKNI